MFKRLAGLPARFLRPLLLPFARLFGRSPPGEATVAEALARFRAPEADTLTLLRRLVATIRPRGRRDTAFLDRYAALLDGLEADPELRAAFRRHLVHFVAGRRLVTFFTDCGILPGTGFFSEWWRIIGSRLLPEVPDERRLKDCLRVIFDRPGDWRWLEDIPPETTQRLWRLLAADGLADGVDWHDIRAQMLDALLLLAHRIGGLGVDDELMRASPNLDADMPRFVALSAEALDYVNAFRAALEDPGLQPDDGSQLLVIADQCQETLQRIRKRALTIGTSLHLSYLLARGDQSLARLRRLVALLNAGHGDAAPDEAVDAWGDFVHAACVAENRRDSLRSYLAQLSALLAARVTENAARSGEHYICESAADYGRMWRSAAGAGIVIGLMALLKIKAAALGAPLFGEAFLYSMIYGLGFVLIFLLGLTVATKQPAMTAQTLAGLLGDLRLSRGADLERMVDVIAAVSRSQLAAIAGNVMLALPVAVLIGVGLGFILEQPPVGIDKSAHLLADLDPLSWALPHAAIAGFYLFLSGLIAGYFDNRAAYADIGPRIARLGWLRGLLGGGRAARVGDYIQEHLGGIMGNFLFGCMLGSTGVIGTILGLPLDIRHIAFASANLGYALTGFQFAIAWQAIAWAALGVAAIGFVNLAVSFGLALRTAMRARGIRLEHGGALLHALAERLRRQPRSFFLPPRAEKAAT